MWVHALNQRPGRTVLQIGGRTLTAAHIRDEVSRLSQAFAACGLGPGSPVATLSLNRPEVIYTNGAALMTGCRTTPLTALASLDDHAHILEDARIDTLVFDPAFDQRAADLQERLPSLRRLLALGASQVGHDLMTDAGSFTARPLRPPRFDGQTVDRIMYTGGTTGRPKGVVGTYRSAAAVARIQMAEWQWPDEFRFLICSPLSHAGGAFLLPALLRGGSLVVLPAFDADEVLAAIERHRITATMLVPTMLYTLLDHPRVGQADLSSLQAIYYGAAAMSPTRLAEAIERFGPIFFQFYGQSEAPMTVCSLRKEEHDLSHPERLMSCGRPGPFLDVALLNDNGEELDEGPGEVCVRGPIVMEGYWQQPDATAEVFHGGWLHTGDVARRDAEGFLTIVDRKKDMIVSGGFNVFAREVEDVLSSHPAVAVVAVIGVPDPKWGEAVKAVVVTRPGAVVTAEELIATVRAAKGPVHTPKSVDFTDAIPTSPLGKPDKKALRARYWTEQDRQVN
jgi:acyl-CoA synthetase (AMP-forming)/AMP-acid ligase II